METPTNVVNFSDLEPSKENIVPLKRGRRASKLAELLSTSEVERRNKIREEKLEWERRIAAIADDDPDPLEHWIRYVHWAQETFISEESAILTIIEQCTRKFKDYEMYRNDLRYLKIWMQYAEKVEDPTDIFAYLRHNEIGQDLALFYECWAAFLEMRGDDNAADQAYEAGINRNAQPLDHLKQRHTDFLHRSTQRIQAQILNPKQESDTSVAEQEETNENKQQRLALGKLAKTKGATSSYRPMAPASSGFPRSRSSGVTMPQKKDLIKPSKNSKIQIFEDNINEESQSVRGGAFPSAASSAVRWDVLPTESEKRKENTAIPSVWTDHRVLQKKTAVVAPPRQSIAIFVDEEFNDAEQQVEQRSNSSSNGVLKLRQIDTGYDAKSAEGLALKKDPLKNFLQSQQQQLPSSSTVPVAPLQSLLDAQAQAQQQQQQRANPQPKQPRHESKSKSSALASASAAPKSKPNLAWNNKQLFVNGVEHSFEEVRAMLPRYIIKDVSSPTGDDMQVDDTIDSRSFLGRLISEKKHKNRQLFTDANNNSNNNNNTITNNNENRENTFSFEPHRHFKAKKNHQKIDQENAVFGQRSNANSRPPRSVPFFSRAQLLLNDNSTNAALSIRTNVLDDDTASYDHLDNQENAFSPITPSSATSTSSHRSVFQILEEATIAPETIEEDESDRNQDEVAPVAAAPAFSATDGMFQCAPLDFEIYVEPSLRSPELRGRKTPSSRNSPVLAGISGSLRNKSPSPPPSFNLSSTPSSPTVRSHSSSNVATPETETMQIPAVPPPMVLSAAIDANTTIAPSVCPPMTLQPANSDGINNVFKALSLQPQQHPTGGFDNSYSNVPISFNNHDRQRQQQQQQQQDQPRFMFVDPYEVANQSNTAQRELDILQQQQRQQALNASGDTDMIDVGSVDGSITTTTLTTANNGGFFVFHDELAPAMPRGKAVSTLSSASSTRRSATAGSNSDFSVHLKDRTIIIEAFLGRGSYAEVYLVREDRNRVPHDDGREDKGSIFYSMKVESPPCPHEFYIGKQIQQRLSSREMSSRFLSPHAMYAFEDKGFILFEQQQQRQQQQQQQHANHNNNNNTAYYYWHATLQDAINAYKVHGKTMDEPLVMLYAIELLRMVEVLHAECRILHGDIKPDNLLLTRNNNNNNSGGMGSGYSIVMIDYGRSIDLTLYPENTLFVGDFQVTELKCVEMRTRRPWTYQIDTYGICGVIHCLLFGEYMEVAHDDDDNDNDDGDGRNDGEDDTTTLRRTRTRTRTRTKTRWRAKRKFKRYWQTDLWSEVFDLLLNGTNSINNDNSDNTGDGSSRSTIMQEGLVVLREVRSKLEAGLRTWLAPQRRQRQRRQQHHCHRDETRVQVHIEQLLRQQDTLLAQYMLHHHHH